MTHCPNCGKTVPDTTPFCAYCGVPISAPSKFLQPLHTRVGKIASTRELLDIFQRFEDVGIYHLYNGDVERWLDEVQKDYELARRAQAIREQGEDRRRGLEELLNLLREELGIARKKPKVIQLRFRYRLTEAPAEPFWYRAEARKIQQYVTSEGDKPVLLTGYGSFGSSYLIQWAIGRASTCLARRMKADEALVTIQIVADLVGRVPADLWAQVDEWVMEVQKSQRYDWFRRQFKDIFRPLTDDPNYTLVEKKERHTSAAVEWRSPGASGKISAPVADLTLDTGYLEVGSRDRETEMVFEPRERDERLLAALRELAHSLPCVPIHGLGKLMMRIRGIGIPYRVVFLLDKVEDWPHLKGLGRFLDVKGALRQIVVVDKDHYDGWVQVNRRRAWLERTFQVIKCLPVWDDDVARRLAQYYFDVDEALSQDPLYQDFLDGLAYRCCGSPGEFAKELAQVGKWPRRELHDQETLVLSDCSDMMQQCHVWAVIERLFRTSWKGVLEGCRRPLPPRNPAVGEQMPRQLLALRRTANVILAQPLRGFTKRQLLRQVAEHQSTAYLVPRRSDLSNICSRTVDHLCDVGVLQKRGSKFYLQPDLISDLLR